MTFRLTSPQAATVSISAPLIACMVRLRLFLITPCSWNAWRVVSRSVPLPKSSAIRSIASHCAGVQTPPGTRTRTMNA